MPTKAYVSKRTQTHASDIYNTQNTHKYILKYALKYLKKWTDQL